MKAKFFIFILLTAIQVVAADTSELCTDNKEIILQYEKQIKPLPNNEDEFTLVTWNAHKFLDKNFFNDLKKLSQDADIILLQEAMHSSSWQSAFLKNFPFSFTFFKSFCTNNNQATGVQSAARFKLLNNINLVSPDKEPITNTPKVSGVSRVEIPGHGSVLIVNTHALNFNTGSSFEHHINQIAAYIETQPGPVIWAGDFNTWDSERQKYLDKKTKALALKNVIPVNDNRKEKLDHIFVRGFTVVIAEVLNQKSSDHRPLRTILKFEN